MMFDFIDEIATDRWKILRMKPFQYNSFSNLDIQVSNEEFEEFVERNRRKIVVEPDMKASYVLIDSNGYLLDNAVDEMTPVVVCDCLMEDFAERLRRLTLDKEKYEARYN